MKDESKVRTGVWICWFCKRTYPNTMIYCPKCNIARKHSINVEEFKARVKKNVKRRLKVRK